MKLYISFSATTCFFRQRAWSHFTVVVFHDIEQHFSAGAFPPFAKFLEPRGGMPVGDRIDVIQISIGFDVAYRGLDADQFAFKPVDRLNRHGVCGIADAVFRLIPAIAEIVDERRHWCPPG